MHSTPQSPCGTARRLLRPAARPRTRARLLSVLALAALALGLGLTLLPTGGSAAPVPLTSFDGTHSGPRASSTVAPNDRPVIFKINEARAVSPSKLAPGGSATFSTKIRVNPYAANWTTAGNLITVGLLREIANETRDGNTPFLPAHDGDPVIWFQNNNPEGVGMCLDRQFLVNNMFAFTQSGVSQCGLPQDNATQTAAAPGSFVKYSVTIFPDNTYRLVAEHLDANGNRVTNLNQLSPAANPYVITGALPHAANSNYFPYLRLRVGRDTGGNGIADPESNWEFQISESALDVEAPLVVRPDSLQGWQPLTSSASQSVDFTTGPAVPPLSTGSVQLSVGPDGDGAAQLRHPGYNNTKLSDLTTLTYSTYVSAPGSGGQAPYLMLGVDHDNNASTEADLLFFEPVYQTAGFFPSNPQPAVVLNTWQTWDARNGGWWSLNGFAGATPGTGVKSLATYFAAFPDAKIVNASSGLGGVRIVAGFGAGAWDNFIGSVDNFRIGVSNDDTTYDFEPLPCATPTNVALASHGATATASSTVNANFPASAAINGDRKGTGWGTPAGGWNDGTRGAFPDTLEINLGVVQQLNEVAVYTLQDGFGSPVEPTDATTFSAYGITVFDVQYWDGDSWELVPNGAVAGNNRVKRRFVFGTPVTTDRVRVVVNASADNLYSRIVEVEAFSCNPVAVPTPTPTPTPSPTPCLGASNNVARATNGSTATASSTVNANFPASGVINGERDGNTWGLGGGWNDGTRGVFPDTVEVNFNTAQTIREIDVYTLKNSFNNGTIVNDTTLATSYGIKNFNVQYWNGSAFVDVPGGAVTNNTLAKRRFVFPELTTDRIRVVVSASNDNTYSRVVEIEAFSCNPVAVRCVNAAGEPGCHVTIQGAIDASPPNGQVNVRPGTYNEDVVVNKAGLKLLGAGAGNTSIVGPIGGPATTVNIAASNVTVAGFTITRAGNNTTDWNGALNTAGVSIGQTLTGALIRDNVFTGNRTGIDINNSGGHTVRNNTIDFNRTGLVFRNQTDNMTVVENFITNNWTLGVIFLDGSGGTNNPANSALHSTFSNNNISANWYGQVVDRQTGGSLPAPGTTNYKNFRGNWLGTTSPVVTTADSAEPGYAAQIPTAYGGTASPPGGQPDIAGPASANIQYTPTLQSGTDTNVETTPGRGTNGFQGVPNTVTVSPANQNGWVFADDLPGTGTGSGGFEAGPATPPLGAGSAFLTVDSQGRRIIGTGGYGGTRMDDLLSLVYSSYQDNNANTVVAPSLQFDIDYDLNDANTAFAGRLVFEPYLAPALGPVQQNVWQTWDARAGNWYGTRTSVTVNNTSGVAQPCQPASPCTWQQVLALFPNAGVRNMPTSAVLFKVGGPWENGFDGNVDAFTLSHNLSRITYNFEHTP